jgi:hypothetical protein
LNNYFTSPFWDVPIQTFIDEYCLIFDEEEENKFEYTVIFEVKFRISVNIFLEF